MRVIGQVCKSLGICVSVVCVRTTAAVPTSVYEFGCIAQYDCM